MLETAADIFLKEDSQNLLLNKYILFIGDSVIRSMYKDFVKLLQTNDHLTDQQLKVKGEFYFENDILLEGGQKGAMTNETSYTEVREFRSEFHMVKFYFITRCYSDRILSIRNDILKDQEKPDVVIMNSGVWDLTRYGPNSIPEYKENLPRGIHTLIDVLPSYTLFIWLTTLPLSKDIKGGFVVPEIELSTSKLREDVLEANFYAARIIDEFKLDLIDLHYYFVNQIQRRAKDGIHWDATAHRRITNLILNHICEAWAIPPPYRILENSDKTNTLTLVNLNNTGNQQQQQIPSRLKNQLKKIDLKPHMVITCPTDSTNNNNNNKRPKFTNENSKPTKRRRSLSPDRLISNNQQQNQLVNGLVPLMALNIPLNPPQLKKSKQQQQQPLDFTSDGNMFTVDFSQQQQQQQQASVINGLNLFMQTFH